MDLRKFLGISKTENYDREGTGFRGTKSRPWRAKTQKLLLRAVIWDGVASLSRCLYPNRCRIHNVRHCRFRIGCNTADVDFAKHVGIFAVFVLWTEQEIAIPENWKTLGIDFK
jgi:hypothetical protein